VGGELQMAEQLADHLGLGARGAGSRVLSKDSGVEDGFAHRGAGIRLEGTIMGGTEQNQARRAWEQARNAKQASEDQLRMMIDSIPTLAWACRPDGTTAFLNQRWLDYTGLSMAQALGWGWQVPIHPDDLGKLMDTWSRLLASGEPGEEEARLRRFDGAYRWCLFRAVPVRDELGHVVQWYGTTTDIEDRKRTEAALRWSEALLAGEKRVLEMIARGEALPRILDTLCRVVEEQSSDMLSSFLLLDANGTHLRHGAAPRLPQSYLEAIDGVAIGPTGGRASQPRTAPRRWSSLTSPWTRCGPLIVIYPWRTACEPAGRRR
jgi:PAS domain S-box-containing protein